MRSLAFAAAFAMVSLIGCASSPETYDRNLASAVGQELRK
jgi:hypothetical protein